MGFEGPYHLICHSPVIYIDEMGANILWMSDKGLTLPMPKGVEIKRLIVPFQPKLLISARW